MCTVRQSDSQVGQSIRASMGPPGWQGRLWAPSSLVSAAALLKGQELMQLQLLLLLSFGSHGSLVVVGCVVQAAGAGAGCWACRWLSCERTDSNCPLLAQARLNTSVHFTQPPFRHAAEIRGRVSAPRSGFCRRPCRRIRRDKHSHRSGPRHSVYAERHEVNS